MLLYFLVTDNMIKELKNHRTGFTTVLQLLYNIGISRHPSARAINLKPLDQFGSNLVRRYSRHQDILGYIRFRSIKPWGRSKGI